MTDGKDRRTEDQSFEIYRQRSETFRHFSNLRWQMLQVTAAVCTAAVLLLGIVPEDSRWLWVFGLLSVYFFTARAVLSKINHGIRENGKALSIVGGEIGDCWIPDVSIKKKSTSHWIEWIFLGLCIISMISFILAAVHHANLSAITECPMPICRGWEGK